MNKVWQIIKYEYLRQVLQKRFLFSLLSFPLMIILMIAVVFVITYFTIDTSPIGYIDQSGLLAHNTPPQEKGSIFEPSVEFISYKEVSDAQHDLENEYIQAYYLIPKTFPELRDVELFYKNMPEWNLQNRFTQFIRENLDDFQDVDPKIVARLEEGSTLTLKTLDNSRELQSDQWIMIVLPFLVGIIFIITVMTSGGYLLQAVVDEKENRTIEIVLTSVTPTQLMAGKIIGNLSIGLTQLIVWFIFGWIGFKIGASFWPVFSNFSLPDSFFVIMLLVFLPVFILIGAIMSTIGAVMTEMREAQQVSSIFSLLSIIPFYVTTSIMNNPNGPLAIALSFFPLTAPITIPMRMGLSTIPFWQLVFNILLLFVVAISSVWLAGRAFQLGMLQLGKKLPLKELFRKGETA